MKDKEHHNETDKLVEQFFDYATMQIVKRMKLQPITVEDLLYPDGKAEFVTYQQVKAERDFLDRLLSYLKDGIDDDDPLYQEIMKRLQQYLSN